MCIHSHVANGDVEPLAAELANGVSVEARDEQGRTLLMVAVESPKSDCRMLQVLMDHGANVNALSAPKEIIELTGDTRATLEEMGVDTSIYDAPCATSVLSCATKTATLDKIVCLLEAGADVNYVDANGYGVLVNAMHRARAESGEQQKAILSTLIDAGAPLDSVSSYGEETDAFGSFPLLQAAQEDAVDCVQVLLDSSVSIDRRNEYQSGAIGEAASPEIVLLVAAGENLSDIGTEMRHSWMDSWPQSQAC